MVSDAVGGYHGPPSREGPGLVSACTPHLIPSTPITTNPQGGWAGSRRRLAPPGGGGGCQPSPLQPSQRRGGPLRLLPPRGGSRPAPTPPGRPPRLKRLAHWWWWWGACRRVRAGGVAGGGRRVCPVGSERHTKCSPLEAIALLPDAYVFAEVDGMLASSTIQSLCWRPISSFFTSLDAFFKF